MLMVKNSEYKFSHPYRVVPGAKEVAFESGALLSADKMNVLYRGVAEPYFWFYPWC